MPQTPKNYPKVDNQKYKMKIDSSDFHARQRDRAEKDYMASLDMRGKIMGDLDKYEKYNNTKMKIMLAHDELAKEPKYLGNKLKRELSKIRGMKVSKEP